MISKRKSFPTHFRKKAVKKLVCNSQSIKKFFRPVTPGNQSLNGSLFSNMNESDSDIEILKSPFEKTYKDDSDDDVIVVKENLKKVKIKHADESDTSKDMLANNEISKLDNEIQTPNKKQSSNYFLNNACLTPNPFNHSNIINKNSNVNYQNSKIHSEKKININISTKNDLKELTSNKKNMHFKRKFSLANSSMNSDSKEQESHLTNNADVIYSEINLNNFNAILDKVINDPFNQCLFNEEDLNIISIYKNLSKGSQLLFLRLFLRKNSWINRKSIKCDESMNNIDEMLNEISKSNFLFDTNEINSLEEGLYILEPNEVKKFAQQLKINLKSTRKKNMIESILHFVRKTNTLKFTLSNWSLEKQKFEELKNYLGNRCVKISLENTKIFLRILLLYFPPIFFEKNINSMMSEKFFNLYNDSMKSLIFPCYNLNKKIQVFTTRNEILLYTDACILESIINEKNPNELDEINDYINKALSMYEVYVQKNLQKDSSLPIFLRKITAGHKLLRCISQCVTLLEKKKSYEEANKHLEFLLEQNLYCLSDRSKWYIRLVTNYETHLKNLQKAYEYCMKAFDDLCVRKAYRLIIHKKSLRLAKKLEIDPINLYSDLKIPEFHIQANKLKRKVDLRNNLFYELNADGNGFTVISVEQVTLNFYLDNLGFTNGLHSENELFNNIFFLLFYNQIFINDDKITDIYRYEFQKLPLDFGTDSFFESRKEHFHARFNFLRNIDSENLNSLIETEYEKYKNINTVFKLDSICLKHLKEIFFCLNIDTLLKICHRLAEDNRFSRSGFPDLIMWNYEERKIKTVEVKGPGDSLSEKQMLWIDFLNEVGLPSEVCYVKAN